MDNLFARLGSALNPRGLTNKCTLDTGEIVEYGACTEVSRHPDHTHSGYNPAIWEYLGKGRIHSSNGFPSMNPAEYHFWKKKIKS